LQTESKNIIVTSAANKIPGSLSFGLDGTLKSGHNMRVFGLGTAAALANRGRYSRFTHAMHAAYAAMEHELDSLESGPAAQFWQEYAGILRREPSLRADLADVDVDVKQPPSLADASPLAGGNGEVGEGVTAQHTVDAYWDEYGEQLTPAARDYVHAIRDAGAADRNNGGARLLGHVYCRYFADLFGGQMLQKPTCWALGLPANTPRHYAFNLPDGGRRAFIARVYTSLNAAGAALPSDKFDAVVNESALVFKLNADVYSEEPMMLDAMVGSLNVLKGTASS